MPHPIRPHYRIQSPPAAHTFPRYSPTYEDLPSRQADERAIMAAPCGGNMVNCIVHGGEFGTPIHSPTRPSAPRAALHTTEAPAAASSSCAQFDIEAAFLHHDHLPYLRGKPGDYDQDLSAPP